MPFVETDIDLRKYRLKLWPRLQTSPFTSVALVHDVPDCIKNSLWVGTVESLDMEALVYAVVHHDCPAIGADSATEE